MDRHEPLLETAVRARSALAVDPGRQAVAGQGTLMHLQRTAGNSAVVWFLQWQAGPGRTATGTPAARGVPDRVPWNRGEIAATEAVELEGDDLAYIQEQLEAATPDEAASGQPEAGEGAEGAEGAGGGPSATQAAPSAEGQAEDVDGLSCIVLDRGVALSGLLADGDGTPVAGRPLSDLDPGLAEGLAMAGVVSTEFNDAAFKSLRALGYIDLASGRTYPPDAVLDISGFPPKGSGFSKQYRLLPTTTRDHSFKVVAAPAGTYDTGLTVFVTVGGQSVELRKMVEVTEDVAARTKRFEQEHVDDTVAAFQMSFQEAADAVNHFADAPDGKDPIYFRGNSEEEVTAYVESRLTDFHGRKKLGGKKEDWVAAYKKLLGLTISERDAKGAHSWSLAPKPKADRAAGTVTYQLLPPSTVAGPSFNEIAWDKI